MLISHESPLCLMEESRQYNDYCYALVHLFEEYPEYYDHFRKSLEFDREVILDNSIFELGTAFDSIKFANWVSRLRPTHYIVPDVLENAEETMINYLDFIEKYPDLPGMRIGVVQGNTYSELIECYQFMCDHADYVAISFDYAFYQAIGVGHSKHHKMMTGRQRFIQMLIDDNIWNDRKPVHLLGCSLPQEFGYYRNVSTHNIRSVDTSNPIMAGLNNMKYANELGLNRKPKGLLADNLHTSITDEQQHLINHNIMWFRSIING